MNKKLLVSVFLCLSFLFMPILLDAQNAEDIIVPEGYKVEKIAETNKAFDAWGLTFDSNGNLIVGSLGYLIYKVDQNGNVNVITKTRRFDFAPIEVEISPYGEYIVLCRYSPESGDIRKISKFTPPDNFEPMIEAFMIYAIAYDRLGNFYAILRDSASSLFRVVRYDSNFQEVDTVFTYFRSFWDIVFDSVNNMYLTVPGRSGYNNGIILKIPAGADGIPGSDDTAEILISNLDSPRLMTFDIADNLYITIFSYKEIDGFSWFRKDKVIKVDSSIGIILKEIADDLDDLRGLIYKDGFIYVSEYARAVISKIDLSSNIKEDLTIDTGINSAGPIAFDSNNNLYTHSFRETKLFRMNESGKFDQVGAGTGYAQSIVSDGYYFYMGSYDQVSENGYQILKIDPIAETMDVISTQLGGFRSVAFDSYGRLILNTEIDPHENLYGADIIDLITGETTPYVTGIHNKARCIQFDTRQNLYVVEGIGDGIKKVWLEENYDPPRDISNEPLFYDFRTETYPPSIYFFYVNQLEEVFIPQMDTGTILMGDKYGTVEILAKGFLLPTYVTFDRFGSMYVSDFGNGIFKITNKKWTIPAIIELKEKLIQEILKSEIAHGIKMSLVAKLENADSALEKQDITAAVNMIQAFKNEVLAQKVKEIPIELADRWINISESIIRALESL